MARKKLKRSIGIIRLDHAEELPGYSEITDVTYGKHLVTALACPFSPVVVMIDNDPAKRYMIPLHEVFKALTDTALKENKKGAKHVNTRGN